LEQYLINVADSTRAGDFSRNGHATVVASKKFDRNP
jgi:hypothetical protein